MEMQSAGTIGSRRWVATAWAEPGDAHGHYRASALIARVEWFGSIQQVLETLSRYQWTQPPVELVVTAKAD